MVGEAGRSDNRIPAEVKRLIEAMLGLSMISRARRALSGGYPPAAVTPCRCPGLDLRRAAPENTLDVLLFCWSARSGVPIRLSGPFR
jgi:hypothetical protein